MKSQYTRAYFMDLVIMLVFSAPDNEAQMLDGLAAINMLKLGGAKTFNTFPARYSYHISRRKFKGLP